MPAGEISHIGVIKGITPENISVEIVSESACGSCGAAGLCSAAEARKKIIDVRRFSSEKYEEGEKVNVVLRQTMGTRAVILAYVIPLVILMIAVVALSYTGLSELVTGFIGIGGVALYYTVLYFFRKTLSKEYVFEIKKK